MRNIFLEKLCTKCGRETSPRPFYKNQNGAYLWIYSLNSYNVCFYCMSKWGGYRKILKPKCKPLAFTLCFSKKQKEVWN